VRAINGQSSTDLPSRSQGNHGRWDSSHDGDRHLLQPNRLGGFIGADHRQPRPVAREGGFHYEMLPAQRRQAALGPSHRAPECRWVGIVRQTTTSHRCSLACERWDAKGSQWLENVLPGRDLNRVMHHCRRRLGGFAATARSWRVGKIPGRGCPSTVGASWALFGGCFNAAPPHCRWRYWCKGDWCSWGSGSWEPTRGKRVELRSENCHDVQRYL